MYEVQHEPESVGFPLCTQPTVTPSLGTGSALVLLSMGDIVRQLAFQDGYLFDKPCLMKA